MKKNAIVTRDQRLGEVAIVVLVFFGLVSILGVIHAEETSQPRGKERQEDRTNRKRNPVTSQDSKKIRDPQTHLSNGNSSDGEDRQRLQGTRAKPTFTPHFSTSLESSVVPPNLKVTAERETTLPNPPLSRRNSRTDVSDEDLPLRLKGVAGQQSDKQQTQRQNSNSLPLNLDSTEKRSPFREEDHRERGKSLHQTGQEVRGNLSPKGLKSGDTAHRSINSSPVESETSIRLSSQKLKRKGEQQDSLKETPPRTKKTKGSENQDDHSSALEKRVELNTLPNAPRPDLQVLISKPDKPSTEKTRTPKIQFNSEDHHADFKPNRHFKNQLSRIPIEKNGQILESHLKQVNLSLHRHSEFQTLLQQGQFIPMTSGKQAQALGLKDQFRLLQRGDVARQMNLSKKLILTGGWQHRKMGVLTPTYLQNSMSFWYPGPSHYPAHCWYPTWASWVDWCWWDYCNPWCDPRPVHCQPVIWNSCHSWTWWACPIWEKLPVVACGTWIDLPLSTSSHTDLQLLAVRFVDPGHFQQETGSRYRAWLRNNSPHAIIQGFNVMLLASNDQQVLINRHESGVRVNRIEAGETMSLDIRLPFPANYSSTDKLGNPEPFRFLTVQIDSHRELPDQFPSNNGTTLVRTEVLPIDPAAFAADPMGTTVGATINIAGEGFGPEPGQVIIQLGNLELQGEIEGWFDLGVRIRVPDLPTTSSSMANIVIIRGDGAASNPLSIEVAPKDSLAFY